MKKTKKVVVGSLATIAVSCALIGGATLAYFTDEASTNIAITAGNVEIAATVKDDFKLWSMDELQTETFANGGTVEYKDGELIIDRITPGDKVAFDIEVTNKSDVAIKYQTQLTATNALLLSGLDVTIDEEKLTAEGMVVVSAWKEVEAYADIDDIHVEIELPKEAGNEYKLQGCTLTVAVNAIQANGEASNLIQVGEHQYIANSAESLIAFAEGLKDGTITSVEGKVAHLTITKDIDLSGYEWMPISGAHLVIDGANHTISNINCGATEDGKSAFVAGYGVTISNLTLENVTAKGAQAAAFIANNQGASGGLINCSLKGNINIAYEEYATEPWGAVGAFYGVYEGDKVENIAVEADTNITIIVVGFTSNLEGKETEDLLLGYNNTGKDITADVAKDESATVTVVEQDYAIDASNNWTVYTAEGLKALATEVNGGNNFSGKTVTLGADIDLGNEPWAPIGKNDTYPFNGNFDGGNHTISNLKVTGANTSFKGLFGRTNTGTIQNFTVNNANVEGYLNVAVVAGVPYTANFNNITVTGHVELNGYAYVGTVGGYNAYGKYTNITVDVDGTSYAKALSINGTTANKTYVGGVIGFKGEGNSTVSDVYCNIDVIGNVEGIGGISGNAHTGTTFDNCTYEGTITVLNNKYRLNEVGGIFGSLVTKATLRDCTFNGTIVAYENGENIVSVEWANQMLAGSAWNGTVGTLTLEGTNTVNGVAIN